MHPIKKMQKILNPTKVQQGTLLSSEGNELVVTTEYGIKKLVRSSNDGTSYKKGDQIRFSGDSLIGRRNTTNRVYVL